MTLEQFLLFKPVPHGIAIERTKAGEEVFVINGDGTESLLGPDWVHITIDKLYAIERERPLGTKETNPAKLPVMLTQAEIETISNALSYAHEWMDADMSIVDDEESQVELAKLYDLMHFFKGLVRQAPSN